MLLRRYLDRCRLRRRTRVLRCRLSQPAFETGLAESCVIVRDERPLAYLDAVVPPVGVGDDLARILVRGEKPPGELIEAKLFWPPISIVPFTGGAVAILATALATSSAAIGWMRAAGMRTFGRRGHGFVPVLTQVVDQP